MDDRDATERDAMSGGVNDEQRTTISQSAIEARYKRPKHRKHAGKWDVNARNDRSKSE